MKFTYENFALIADTDDASTQGCFQPQNLEKVEFVSCLFLDDVKSSMGDAVYSFIKENIDRRVFINTPRRGWSLDMNGVMKKLKQEELSAQFFILDGSVAPPDTFQDNSIICEILTDDLYKGQTLYSAPSGHSTDVLPVLQSLFKSPALLSESANTVYLLKQLFEFFKLVQSAGVFEAMRLARLRDLNVRLMLDIIQNAGAKSGLAFSLEQALIQGDINPEHDIVSDWLVRIENFQALLEKFHLPNSMANTIKRALKYHQSAGIFEQLHDEYQRPRRKSLDSKMMETSEITHSSSKPGSVFVCGLGPIGMGIAQVLGKSGIQTYAADIQEERLRQAQEYGVQTVSLAKGLELADHICMVVTSAEQILGIIEEHESILRKRKEQTWLLHSTMMSFDAIRIGERLENVNQRITVIDAPVSGGPVKAENGELLIMLGGPVPSSSLPVLKLIAARLILTDNLGDGCYYKAFHQIPAVLNLTSALYCFNIGLGFGFSKTFLYEFFKSTSAWNMYLIERLPKLMASDFRPDAQLSIWTKDLGIIQKELKEMGETVCLVDDLQSIYAEAFERGLGHKADIAVGVVMDGLYERLDMSESGFSVKLMPSA